MPLTPEEIRANRKILGRTGSAAPSALPVPVIPIDDSSSAQEVLKGLVSGYTGELADLGAHWLGSDIMEQDPNNVWPYRAGYLVGSLGGIPQRTGLWVARKVGKQLLPNANDYLKAAASTGLTNAALAGVSAAGQGEDVAEGVARGGVIGALLGPLGHALGPSINRMLGGTKYVPEWDLPDSPPRTGSQASRQAKTNKGDETVAGLTPRTPPPSEPEGPRPTVGRTTSEPRRRPPARSYTEAAEESYRRLHPEETPPPADPVYPVNLNPDDLARLGEETQRQNLRQLFPNPAGQAVDELSVPVPFTTYVSNSIEREILDRFQSDEFDFSDIVGYGRRYLQAKANGMDSKSKEFPRPKTEFEKDIKELIDRRYKEISDEWAKVYGLRGNTPPEKKPAPKKTEPDIAAPAPIVPPAAVVSDASQVEPPVDLDRKVNTLISGARKTRTSPAVDYAPTSEMWETLQPPVFSVTPERQVFRSEGAVPAVREVKGLPSPYMRVYRSPVTGALTQQGESQVPVATVITPPEPAREVNRPVSLTVPPPNFTRPRQLTDQAPEYAWAEALDADQLPLWARRVLPGIRRSEPEVSAPAPALTTKSAQADFSTPIVRVEEPSDFVLPPPVVKPTITPTPEQKPASVFDDPQLREEAIASRPIDTRPLREALKELDKLKKSVAVRPGQAWDTEGFTRRLKLEQLERTKDGLIAKKLSPILAMTESPTLMARLEKLRSPDGPSYAQLIRNLADQWKQAQSTFDPAAYRVSATRADIEKSVQAMRKANKSPQAIAIQLAAQMKKKVGTELVGSESVSEEVGAIASGPHEGLFEIAREGGVATGKLSPEYTALFSKTIEELIGPESARRLIEYAVNAGSESAILKNGMAVLQGRDQTAIDVASTVAKLKNKLKDPSAVYLNARLQTGLSDKQLEEELGKVPDNLKRAAGKLSPPAKALGKVILSPDDEAI